MPRLSKPNKAASKPASKPDKHPRASSKSERDSARSAKYAKLLADVSIDDEDGAAVRNDIFNVLRTVPVPTEHQRATHRHNPNTVGGPSAYIDVEQVEKLAMLSCTLDEIAAYLGINPSTLDLRLSKDPVIRAALERGKSISKISVRRMQMHMMLSGNAAMGIWLGKQLLGQRDQGYQDITYQGQVVHRFAESPEEASVNPYDQQTVTNTDNPANTADAASTDNPINPDSPVV